MFPNPWRIDGIGTATAGLGAGNALRRQIGNLPTAQVQIRIYTSGQKVIEGDLHTATGAGNTANGHLRAIGDGRVSWDLWNQWTVGGLGWVSSSRSRVRAACGHS